MSELPQPDSVRRHALEDFVYALLCARARRQMAPLDGATLRGLVSRWGTRPSDLLVVHPRPLEVLNGDVVEGVDFARVGALFMAAMVRRAAEVGPDGRDAFVALMSDVLRTLAEHTPFAERSAAAGGDPIARTTVNMALVAAGLKPTVAEALGELRAALPSFPVPAGWQDYALPAQPVPMGTERPGPVLMPMAIGRASGPSVQAALAILLSSLKPLVAPDFPVVPRPEPFGPTAALPRPSAVVVLPLRGYLPEHGGKIVVRRADRRRRRRTRLAFWIGVLGSLVGFPVLLEGLVAQSLWTTILGAVIVVATLSSDFWIIRALGRERRSV